MEAASKGQLVARSYEIPAGKDNLINVINGGALGEHNEVHFSGLDHHASAMTPSGCAGSKRFLFGVSRLSGDDNQPTVRGLLNGWRRAADKYGKP